MLEEFRMLVYTSTALSIYTWMTAAEIYLLKNNFMTFLSLIGETHNGFSGISSPVFMTN